MCGVLKLNYQVQQLELYVYFLPCSAQGKMSKRCKGWLSPGRLQSVWRRGAGSAKAWTVNLLLVCCCVAPASMWEIIWKSNFGLERARKHLVVQKHGECFLLCQFISTYPCLLLSPVRWKQWWIHVDPRMTLHFLQGNCCSVCEKEHRQLFQEHFSSPLLKCCRARFCCKQQEPFSSWISFQYTLLMQVIQPAVWNLEYPFCHYWQPIAQVRLS